MLAGLAVLLASPAAPAQSLELQGSAAARFEAGMQHYNAGDWDQAIAEFEAAYRLEPRRELLFAMAQAARLANECGRAATFYRRFLDTAPPERQAVAARQQMAACDREASSDPSPDEVNTPAPSTHSTPGPSNAPAPRAAPRNPAPAPAPTPVRERTSPWYADGWGHAFLGSAVALAGVGTYFVIDAQTLKGSTYGDFEAAIDRADTRRTIGYATLGAAGALSIAAIIRYATGNDPEPVAPAVTGFVNPRSAGVGIAGRF